MVSLDNLQREDGENILFLQLRRFWRSPVSGEIHPTKTGVAMNLKQVESLESNMINNTLNLEPYEDGKEVCGLNIKPFGSAQYVISGRRGKIQVKANELDAFLRLIPVFGFLMAKTRCSSFTFVEHLLAAVVGVLVKNRFEIIGGATTDEYVEAEDHVVLTSLLYISTIMRELGSALQLDEGLLGQVTQANNIRSCCKLYVQPYVLTGSSDVLDIYFDVAKFFVGRYCSTK